MNSIDKFKENLRGGGRDPALIKEMTGEEIKKILKDVQDKCDGFNPHTIYNTDYKDSKEFDILVSHHRTLRDYGLIDVDFMTQNYQDKVAVLDIIRKGITFKGQDELERLQKEKH